MTQIVLEETERIIEAAAGDSVGWGILARRGAHQIFVRPRDLATHSNLAVTTDKRIYNFDLRILPPNPTTKSKDPSYRIEFLYPEAPVTRADNGFETSTLSTNQAGTANGDYSMQSLPHSESITPDEAFDDGQFTYLHFPINAEIPAVFEVAEDESESLINLHFDHDLMVIHGIFRRLVLRLGGATVALWNDAWHPTHFDPNTGTTVPGQVRVSKEP